MTCPRTQNHLARLGIEPATFRLLAQFPNHSATRLLCACVDCIWGNQRANTVLHATQPYPVTQQFEWPGSEDLFSITPWTWGTVGEVRMERIYPTTPSSAPPGPYCFPVDDSSLDNQTMSQCQSVYSQCPCWIQIVRGPVRKDSDAVRNGTKDPRPYGQQIHRTQPQAGYLQCCLRDNCRHPLFLDPRYS